MHDCRGIKTIPPGPVDTSFYPGQQTAESAANAARRVPAQLRTGQHAARRRPIHAPALKGNRYQCLNRCAPVRPSRVMATAP